MLLFLALACGPAELTVSPTHIAWEEVDFQQARPDDGYGLEEVTLTNTGERTLELQVRGVDEEHVVVEGRWLDPTARTLYPLEPGLDEVLTVAVWDYVPGERDAEVSGRLELVDADRGVSEAVDWTFTPVRRIEGDTDE